MADQYCTEVEIIALDTDNEMGLRTNTTNEVQKLMMFLHLQLIRGWFIFIKGLIFYSNKRWSTKKKACGISGQTITK